MFTRPEPTTLTRIRMTLNGQPVVATAVDSTVVVSHDADHVRCSLTSRDGAKRINITTEPDDEQLRWLADERTREAAARPATAKSERPSARLLAARRTAKEYHQTVWNHGLNEGEARYAARPLAERVTERDVPELIEYTLRSVLGSAELREQLRSALDACEIEMALAPSVPAWVAERVAS